MFARFTDFNNAESLIINRFQNQWDNIQHVIKEIPLQLKASDQKGKKGNPIFDPVGTNEHLKNILIKHGWNSNVKIPEEFIFLGKDVDFTNNGVLVEVQFSNYPFLLNNIVRSELFYKAKTPLPDRPVELLFIITKAHMFPSSNSTLYYEQAIQQLTALAKNKVFDIPTRLIGLFENHGLVSVIWNKYTEARYSRKSVNRINSKCEITPGGKSICRLKLID